MNTLLTIWDTQLVRLRMHIHNMDVSAYQFIQVWRSVLGVGGPYYQITEAGYAPASTYVGDGSVSSTATGPSIPIFGQRLAFRLHNENTYEYTFPGLVNLTFRECADLLNAAFPTLVEAGVMSDGRFFLRTKKVGDTASIAVAKGNAATLLGLSDSVYTGKESNLPLVPGSLVYEYTDRAGNKDYHYKIRLASADGTVFSEFSPPIYAGTNPTMVPIENLILGFVKLVDIQGRIASDREVAVYSPFISQKIGDRLVTGGEFSTRTDNAGYASFYLLRGTTVDLSVLGTSLLQRVRVPSDLSLTEFDLLDPAYADRDSFAVQKTNQPFAERRNL